MKALLDSSVTELVMSSKFVRKNKFKMRRLNYVRNVDNTFNYKGLIEYMVEIELFFKRHKEKMLIDMIGSQKYIRDAMASCQAWFTLGWKSTE